MVVSLVVVSVGNSANARTVGRLGRNSLFVVLAMLVGAAIIVALIVPPLMNALPLSDASVAAMRQTGAAPSAGESAPVRLSDFILGLVPVNPMKAAADGALLPLVVFSIVTGIALTKLSDERSAPVIGFFSGVADAMIVVVRWLLVVAPIGVFALALPLAARMGIAGAGAFAYYIAVIAIVGIVIILMASVVAIVAGHFSVKDFIRCATPVQAVAFSSRSSLASLPALLEESEKLGLPLQVRGFFLPLAVATFRLGAIPGMFVGTMFLARLYGLEISAAQMMSILLTAILLSFSIPGIPGGGILVMAPILVSVGIPVTGIGILLALDTISDMFRTTMNVTADITGATILSRLEGAEMKKTA
jgi:Na+/H+-dicarboxylate symporter